MVAFFQRVQLLVQIRSSTLVLAVAVPLSRRVSVALSALFASCLEDESCDRESEESADNDRHGEDEVAGQRTVLGVGVAYDHCARDEDGCEYAEWEDSVEGKGEEDIEVWEGGRGERREGLLTGGEHGEGWEVEGPRGGSGAGLNVTMGQVGVEVAVLLSRAWGLA